MRLQNTHKVYFYSLAVTVLTIANTSMKCWTQMSKYVVIMGSLQSWGDLGPFRKKNHICSINQAQIKRDKVKQYHTQWITDCTILLICIQTNPILISKNIFEYENITSKCQCFFLSHAYNYKSSKDTCLSETMNWNRLNVKKLIKTGQCYYIILLQTVRVNYDLAYVFKIYLSRGKCFMFHVH